MGPFEKRVPEREVVSRRVRGGMRIVLVGGVRLWLRCWERVPYVPIAGDGLREWTGGQQRIWLRVSGAMFSLGACRSVEIVFEAIDGWLLHVRERSALPPSSIRKAYWF